MQLPNYQEAGGVLKMARLDKCLTQKQLAERLGITVRHLISVEKGHRVPSCDLLFRMVRELDISADEIFYPELTGRETALSRLKTLLRRCSDREMDIIISAIQTLLETQNRERGESDVTLDNT